MVHTPEVAEGPVRSTPEVHEAITPEKVKDSDEALNFLRKQEVGDESQYVDEKALLRKIDWMVMPLMFCCYLLEYLDKSLLNYASVMGLLDDANISTNHFANLSLLFYVAFLAFELPHAYLMQRFPAAKYLGVMVMCWGAVVACTAACNSYGSLVAVRFLLGMFESTISPSLIIITTMWYKTSEQPIRVGLWYIGVGTGSILGALISFGFQHYHSQTFKSWQAMFLVVGLVTMFVGGLVIWLLPDNPMSSRLSHAEKIVAIDRIRGNNTGIENKHFKLYQVLECLRDPQVLLLSLLTIAGSVPNGAVSSFQSIVIKSLGFSEMQTTLLQIPSGAIAVLSVLSATWLASKYNARGVNIIIWSAIGGLLGGSLLAFLPEENKAGKLVGNYLCQVVGAFLPCAYSFAGANFAGHTKKVTVNAIILMSFCIGNIVGPLTFRDQDAPNYTPAKVTIVAVDSATIVLTTILLFYYKWENKRRDQRPQEHVENVEFLDLTDRQNKEFRYSF
ncbi:MFS general substrate transporter [Penicillium bovifimosum]|uniref:MFS general substrate transporter n=1 Tax=Penicillium bovifimosum TaxID=126998 RepID=A0A9W9GHF1_9EURO|nr:MFS general substrate transporter [Penicillium bovifimosum]KAJ5120463.1 MFS general substrate transporter [Penicillium bovifimosum]